MHRRSAIIARKNREMEEFVTWSQEKSLITAVGNFFAGWMEKHMDQLPPIQNEDEFFAFPFREKVRCIWHFLWVFPPFIGVLGTMVVSYVIWKLSRASGYEIRILFFLVLAILWFIGFIQNLFA